ncbi:MAG: hypothetical protein ACODAD_03350 [Planctomycetota bacterium]
MCKSTLITLVAVGLVGCRVGDGLFSPPGKIEKQRFDATVFDPYTDNQLGPEVVGGRPRGFQKPHSDSDRSRLFQESWLPFNGQ